MVRVVGMTPKEREAEQSQSKLIEVARQTFHECSVLSGAAGFKVHFPNVSGHLDVCPSSQTIYVPNPKLLNNALELAGRCERLENREYTVKRYYD